MKRLTALAAAVLAVGVASPSTAQARTYVGCSNSNYTRVVAKIKPSDCTLLALRGTGLVLEDMEWRRWGAKVAIGTGLASEDAIRIKLYRRVRYRGGACYTRASYTGDFGSGRLAFAKCGWRSN